MTYSIRRIIRAFVAPKHRLSCSSTLWDQGLAELRRRGAGVHESGAFLLGRIESGRRSISRFAFYDDLDPTALKTGIVIFHPDGYGPLWALCRATGLSVVGDVHTHPGHPIQSGQDRAHPMVASAGHIAIILPNYAQKIVRQGELGMYEYISGGAWRDHSGAHAREFFYIGSWG